MNQRSLGLFYLVDHFVTFGGSEKSGYQKVREKILKYYESQIQTAELYDYHWRKLSSIEEKKEYLKKLKLEEFIIPYSFYSQCWDEAHNPETIKLYSLEVCYYYMKQNDVPLDFGWGKKAPENFSFEGSSEFIYAIPCLKWVSKS